MNCQPCRWRTWAVVFRSVICSLPEGASTAYQQISFSTCTGCAEVDLKAGQVNADAESMLSDQRPCTRRAGKTHEPYRLPLRCVSQDGGRVVDGAVAAAYLQVVVLLLVVLYVQPVVLQLQLLEAGRALCAGRQQVVLAR